MGRIRSFYFRRMSGFCTLRGLPEEDMGTERDRVISITLTEAEWQAFVAAQPQPVNWLRERIREVTQTVTPVSRQNPDTRQVA